MKAYHTLGETFSSEANDLCSEMAASVGLISVSNNSQENTDEDSDVLVLHAPLTSCRLS